MSTGPVGNTGFLSELDIRIWMRDTCPEANTLLLDLEFTPEEIRHAQTLAVDLWNETPPSIRKFDVVSFPWRYHLLLQTTANLLTIAAFRYHRNHLNYQVPGGAINDQDKGPMYNKLAADLGKRFMDWMRDKKIECNVDQGWGHV